MQNEDAQDARGEQDVREARIARKSFVLDLGRKSGTLWNIWEHRSGEARNKSGRWGAASKLVTAPRRKSVA